MSLFVPNRLPGYDRVDSGQRVDYGLHGEINTQSWGTGRRWSAKAIAASRARVFQPGSGLEDRLLRHRRAGRRSRPASCSTSPIASGSTKGDFADAAPGGRHQCRPRRACAPSLSFISIAPGIPGADTVPTRRTRSASALNAQLTRYWSVALNDTRSIGGGGRDHQFRRRRSPTATTASPVIAR